VVQQGLWKGDQCYVKGCGFAIRKLAISILVLVAFTVGTGIIGGRVPGGFLPEEDQGYMFAGVQLPDAASCSDGGDGGPVEKIVMNTPASRSVWR